MRSVREKMQPQTEEMDKVQIWLKRQAPEVPKSFETQFAELDIAAGDKVCDLPLPRAKKMPRRDNGMSTTNDNGKNDDDKDLCEIVEKWERRYVYMRKRKAEDMEEEVGDWCYVADFILFR